MCRSCRLDLERLSMILELWYDFLITCMWETATRPVSRHRALALTALAVHDTGPRGDAIRAACGNGSTAAYARFIDRAATPPKSTDQA